VNVAPAALFEAVIDTGLTGLVGTIGVGADDNQGGTGIAFTTLGVAELAPGVYAATGLVAPDTQGQYTLIWREGAAGQVLGIEDLTVTSSAPGLPPDPGDTYCTTDELFRVLKIRTPSSEQVAAADRVLLAAREEIDQIMGRADPLTARQLELAAQVNLERGEELWQETESPWGAIGLGSETGPVFAPRRSRALAKLTPLVQSWGVG
jgi:hypothetical protein